MGYSPPRIKPPLPLSLSLQGRGAGVRGVYVFRGARSNRPTCRENRPYSFFRNANITIDLLKKQAFFCGKSSQFPYKPCSQNVPRSYHLSCVPKKGDPKKGTRRKFFTGMLGRPQYISETCPSGFGHPKCLTLGLGRLPKFSYETLDSRFAIPSEMVRQWVYVLPLIPISRFLARWYDNESKSYP